MTLEQRYDQVVWFFQRKTRIIFLTIMSYAALC